MQKKLLQTLALVLLCITMNANSAMSNGHNLGDDDGGGGSIGTSRRHGHNLGDDDGGGNSAGSSF